MINEFFAALQLVLGGLGVLLLALILLGQIILVLRRGQGRSKGPDHKIKVTHLNEKYEEHKEAILAETLSKKEYKAFHKENARIEKERDKTEQKSLPKVFVLDFDGDMAASRVSVLREQITALIGIAGPADEVVVRLESPGGVVHGYGLAASQLARLRAHKISLTVCVDKVAASGGYMMACIANQILCAPFAIVGSIGVVASLPNLNRLLKSKNIDYLELTAGEHKRTLTMLGEVTEKGREKFVEQLEDTHLLFKEFVVQHRPQLHMEQVATGEHWFGTRALDLKLVDKIETSDDYLLAASKKADVYLIEIEVKETLRERVLGMVSKISSEAGAAALTRALRSLGTV